MKNEAKDLEVLHREYRNMEMNRKSFADESNSTLRKQQQTLDTLRTENEHLKTDLATIQARTTMKPLNSLEQSQLDHVTLEIERYRRSIETERNKISIIEEKTSSLGEKIWRQRKKMGGKNAATENQRTVDKQVKILENRLDQANVKFNKSLANNRKLREEIDNLRGERTTFNSVYKKLEKGLQEWKRQMVQVIEHSNLAYEQRDRSRLEIVAIDQTNKKEQEIFDRHMEDMRIKLEEEIMAATERRKSQQPQDIISEEESKAAAEKAAKEIALRKEKEAIVQQRSEKIQHFEEAFRKIAASTGVSDVDKLVQRFMVDDEQNFSLFTYANEQANEIESIENQIQKFGKDKSIFTDGYEQNNDTNQYEKASIEFETQIEAANCQTEKVDIKCTESSNVLDALNAGIKMMVTRLDCNDNSIGDEVSVNEANMLNFLAIIEQRTNDIINGFYNCNLHLNENMSDLDDEDEDAINSTTIHINNNNKYNNNKNIKSSMISPPKDTTHLQCILGVGPKMPMALDVMNVNPPKLLDFSSDENSVDEINDTNNELRPLSLDEVKSKMMNRLANQRRSRVKTTDGGEVLRGRRGSILAMRRRSSLVAAESAISMMSTRRTTISVNR